MRMSVEIMLKDRVKQCFMRAKQHEIAVGKIPFLNNMHVIIELEIFNGVGKALEFILVVIIGHFKLEVR